MAAGRSKKTPLLQALLARFPQQDEKDAYSRILCGDIAVNGGIIRDPKFPLGPEDTLELRDPGFVSRGAEKLNGALDAFGLDVRGRIFLDAGCSTGGFTQCLLLRGAEKVYAVDVGYNQLDYSLRTDPRVIPMERQNIMDLPPLDPPPWGAVADLSFRSVVGAAGRILSLCTGNLLAALIKPQFEWKNPPPEFRGVIRDPGVIRDILREVARELTREGIAVDRAAPSPIKGRKGNQEFFYLLRRGEGLSPEEIPGHLGL